MHQLVMEKPDVNITARSEVTTLVATFNTHRQFASAAGIEPLPLTAPTPPQLSRAWMDGLDRIWIEYDCCNLRIMPRLIVVYVILALALQPSRALAQGPSQSVPSQSVSQTGGQGPIETRQFGRTENLTQQELHAAHGSFTAYLSLGHLELSRKRIFASVRAFRQAAILQPDNCEAHRQLAIDYFLLNQKVLFKQQIREALQANREDEQSYYLAGRFAYEVEKGFGLAADYFSKAIALDDSDYKAHYYLGLSCKSLGETSQAQQELERAGQLVTSRKVKYDLPFRSLSELFSEKNEPEKAWENAKKAIAVDPSSPENYYFCGKAEIAMGKIDIAAQSLQQSTLLDPTYAQPYYLLGQIYYKTGRRVLADEAYARFESLQKEYEGK